MKSIRVLIVDDHESVREGLQTLLAEEPDFEVVGTAGDGVAAVAMAESTKPDVVVMDLVMPGLDGIEATRRIHNNNPQARVLVLTTFADDQRVREAIQAGATGYLLKDVLKADLLRALRDAAVGRPSLHPEVQQHLMREVAGKTTSVQEQAPHTSLTERESSILRLIAEGRSNKEIAAALYLTEGTIKGYVSTIFDKLGVEDRTQAALYAVKHGLT
ncbi:MAG TPA: response regulator transcription factor [Candidatus Saccharimonadales bacterium]|nr:response regulator transcription factor [Candidatus Saccharimonadales bacterium]